MCGIFVFKGEGNPDPDLYAQQIRFAGRRGPHGHGWWTAEAGLYRAPGSLQEGPSEVFGGIVGHSRLSTMGDAGMDGVQPVLTDGADVLVHNGNVYNWADIDPAAVTDSFALGGKYSELRDMGAPPVEALELVLHRAQYEATALAVLDRAGTILAYRRRLPLFYLFHETGVYLSSGQLDGSSEIPAETLLIIGPDGSVEVRTLWTLQRH